MVPEKGLPKVVDNFFIQRLKQDEMSHAEVDPRLYEGMRTMVKEEVLPLYEQFRSETAKVRERRQKRKLWQYVLGTVAVVEVLEAIVTRGKSMAPQVLFPTVILNAFIGFIIYTAAQYVDDLFIGRARKRLERTLESLDEKVVTDINYDQRRELLNSDVLQAEVMEVLTQYQRPEDFWRDFYKVLTADPKVPGEVAALKAPAFEQFLKLHVDGQYSEQARQQRFNALFMEAQRVLISRDREHYVTEHLKKYLNKT